MLNRELKNELVEKGLLREVVHQSGELFLYNYTQQAQFDKDAFKTYPILKQCRGLILNKEGKMVARPFAKFHNLEEYGSEATIGELPTFESFEITDKLDGSLGILYTHNGGVFLATRGSFESDQAKWATEFLHSTHPIFVKNFLDGVKEGMDVTFLFEIIYPENRIVVDYKGDNKLILLTVFNNEDGEEMDRESLSEIAFQTDIPLVHSFDGIDDFKTIREILKRDNAEGFVIKFNNGIRVKMKYEEYVRLHRIVTGTSSRSLWENMRAGKNVMEIIEHVPDEFHKWASEWITKLTDEYKFILAKATKALEEIPVGESRKNQALLILEKYKDISGTLFQMLDGKPYSDGIWRMIEPKYEQPFKNRDEA